MKRLSKVKIIWSSNFAYVIGLITTDGNLSKDGRHINFTSKDYDLAEIFKRCLSLNNKIGRKARGGSSEKKYFVVQFGDKNFYNFLLSLGLMPAKSKILTELQIPQEYFPDFFRGCIDGDGNISVTRHPESSHPQLRIRLCSASLPFLEWVKKEILKNFNINTGWIKNFDNRRVAELTFGKRDSIVILKLIYYPKVESYLSRKYIIARPFLENGIV